MMDPWASVQGADRDLNGDPLVRNVHGVRIQVSHAGRTVASPGRISTLSDPTCSEVACKASTGSV
jgi:hypothetical protein